MKKSTHKRLTENYSKNDNRKSKSWNAPDSIEIGRVTNRGCQLDDTGTQKHRNQKWSIFLYHNYAILFFLLNEKLDWKSMIKLKKNLILD